MKFNKNALFFWAAVGLITYGIFGLDTALISVGIAICFSVLVSVLFA